MTLLLMVRRSLQQHALSTVVTAGSIALAGGLLMSVWTTRDEAQETFTGMATGFDGVLGARGSKLQLVLNSVFHLETSPGNVAWEDYLEIRDHPAVELAVPLAMGDNYRGFRIVGTTHEMFERSAPSPEKSFSVAEGGRWFDPQRREAVVGSFVARQLSLEPGDTFHPAHGVAFAEGEQHAETYLVVGVLEPTNSPADRVLWIPLAGVQKMSGHDPDAASQVSAVLVKLKGNNPAAALRLDARYNREGNRLTFAWPIAQIVMGLFDKISWFDRVLALVAGLVVLLSAAFITASLYNSMNERRRDLAILRALGAKRATVFSATLLEAVAIATVGMLAAFAIHFAMMSVVGSVLRAQTGVVLEVFAFHAAMLWAPIGVIALGAMAGLVPALKAYRTNVADNLYPLS